jgi:hypothetical protein
MNNITGLTRVIAILLAGMQEIDQNDGSDLWRSLKPASPPRKPLSLRRRLPPIRPENAAGAAPARRWPEHTRQLTRSHHEKLERTP